MLKNRSALTRLSILVLLTGLSMATTMSSASRNGDDEETDHYDVGDNRGNGMNIQLGPRPYFLVNDMRSGALKSKLKHCGNGPFYKTDFSIAHRGAALQFPEHTKESYVAAARMGAGIVE